MNKWPPAWVGWVEKKPRVRLTMKQTNELSEAWVAAIKRQLPTVRAFNARYEREYRAD